MCSLGQWLQNSMLLTYASYVPFSVLNRGHNSPVTWQRARILGESNTSSVYKLFTRRYVSTPGVLRNYLSKNINGDVFQID